MLEKTAAGDALETITAAAGLAALANIGTSPEWKSQAYSMYGTAIRRLHASLQAPDQVVSDQTLAAVMMMGVFEVIASGNLDSMKSFAIHTIAAARCIEMRGPSQFCSGSGASSALFLQLRRIIVMTSHQLQEPVPYVLKRWSNWAESADNRAEAAANRFAELNGKLAAARAEIKQRFISSPEIISAMLLPIDTMFEDWRQTLPVSWTYKSYRHLHPEPRQERQYTSQYDVYPDLYIASTWNNYRSVRILIHESIIAAIMKRGAQTQDTVALKRSFLVLRAMADGICHSVPYHLQNHQNYLQDRGSGFGNDKRSGDLPLSGGSETLDRVYVTSHRVTDGITSGHVYGNCFGNGNVIFFS
ncbi:hypothetical protein NLG97_g1592 [Lecanicillium saksenae]|uniref:Uncharacterized protein n=1 Tax=Lecanicillium saksenae TaxID=468837 RepID=A0ACC1R567_9HYPO|nr:hypothetical protein NLG97_g1592 [Lecanicillium saksenae]